ncbi:TOMM system kinase/cyclase fusion protein [Photobacterium rosenbergii]|uniref:TOMM system kinase/cyclase fusion protein n=1 Tax=Photobacterium rosenbergii TaxID=294936 RepID=A0ABU3ZCH7_9GAMM|nr:TOMM system kinase/cyclase fusion protein [Photobacterium rosenbergii]MDV5167811.1 TOMM system kinase/cyclase fusion protein [Photobacterium rosenbergii]
METDFLTEPTVESNFESYDYKLVEKIGEGGFGQVYKAIQLSTQKQVAIKFLTLNPLASREKNHRHIERFHRECDLICRLNHPNIVHLIDKGQQGDDLIYAVYELIDGETLKQRLEKKGALEPVEAAEIMAAVLDALAHAHEKGVIHRDIKPGNIMLYRVGAKTHVKVLDFGIGTLKSEARQLDYKSITLSQETLGTPTYSAPEQLRGEPPVAQTDIYVWGLVFLECLFGKPPITGRSLADIFHQHLSPANISLGVLAGHNSAHFFRRVLNKKYSDRPDNTASLYHELCQLNFSDLTGCLKTDDRLLVPSQHFKDHANGDTETAINQPKLTYSQLTERKQISALSVIVTTDRVDNENNNAIDQDVIDTIHADQMQQCIDIAVRYGATHVGTLGDTVLFYFGFPQVTENDGRLCCRAALEIASNFKKKNLLLEQNNGLVCRYSIGIESGVMLSFADNLPQGKVAHQAMQLSRYAGSGKIVCSESVRRLLQSHHHFEKPQTNTELEAGGCAMYTLLGERQSEAFGFLRGHGRNGVFIGRSRELTDIEAILSAHFDGGSNHHREKVTHVHLCGEAGVGKSRLIYELRGRFNNTQHLIAQCLPEHQNNALFPILKLLSYQLELEGLNDDLILEILNKAMIRSGLEGKQLRNGYLVLSMWMGLPLEERDELAQLTPERQKTILFYTLAILLCHSSKEHTQCNLTQYLFFCEDIHWADSTTIEFIRYLVDNESFVQRGHAWVNTSRLPLPETLSDGKFETVSVDKFDTETSNALIDALFEQQPIETELRSLLLERTDGVPLFIEELVSSLRSQQLVHKINGVIKFINSDKRGQLPETLRSTLQQKLDRLVFAKDTAQLASCIGRTFNHKVLTAVCGKGEAQLQMDLEELLKSELVVKHRQADGDIYIFKHALVRDAAYDSLTQRARRECHQLIADELCRQQDEGHRPSDIGRHYASAQNHDKAAYFYDLAGEKALHISSNNEAVTFFNESIKQLELCETDKIEETISVYGKLSNALTMKAGYASDEVEEIQSKVAVLRRFKSSNEEISLQCDGTSMVQAATDCWGQSVFQMVSANFNDAMKITSDYRSALDKAPALYQICPNLSDAFIYLWQGENRKAHDLLVRTETLSVLAGEEYGTSFHELCTSIYGYNTFVASKVYLGLNTLVLTGDKGESIKLAVEALRLAKESGHPYTHVHCLCRAALIYALVGNYPEGHRLAAEAKQIATQCDIALWLAVAGIIEAYCDVFMYHKVHSLEQLRISLDAYSKTGAVTNNAIYQTLYAEALLESGEAEHAAKVCRRTVKNCDVTGDNFYLSETYRVLAKSLGQSKTRRKEAQGYVELAEQIAVNQEARLFIKRLREVR